MNVDELQNEITQILKLFHPKPFLCLPMSAYLYAIIKDKYHEDVFLVTGDLSVNEEIVFKQDFKIESSKPNELQSWSGHAWVEYGEYIIDLSFFRTLYSDEFNKSCKPLLIKKFGLGRGAIIATKDNLKNEAIVYTPQDILKDETATGIIKGAELLPIWN